MISEAARHPFLGPGSFPLPTQKGLDALHAVIPAIRAYQRMRAAKSVRELEAEVFAIAAGRLRNALSSGSILDKAKARSDARRLFSSLRLVVMHPSSGLPLALRASIVSVCDCALREVEKPDTDLEFLAMFCDDFQQGLLARPESSAQ
jgi:hypothetical protein